MLEGLIAWLIGRFFGKRKKEPLKQRVLPNFTAEGFTEIWRRAERGEPQADYVTVVKSDKEASQQKPKP